MAKDDQEGLNIKEILFVKEIISGTAVFSFAEVCLKHFEVTEEHEKIQKEWPQRANMTLNCVRE